MSTQDTEFIANVVGREVEEKNYKAICKQMGVDEYEDRGWMFQFKYKGTLYKYHKNLSEEEKFKAIQNVKNIHELVDEYKDHGSMFSFKYKGTTGSIYRKNLSEEEKFQIIQRVKNSGLDEYEDRGWMFSFKYEGTTYRAEHKGYLLVEEEKLRLIQDIKNSHESLVSERYRLNEGQLSQNATVVISIDENKEISQMYFHNPDKNMSEWLDKTLISRSKPEVDVDEIEQPSNFLSNIFQQLNPLLILSHHSFHGYLGLKRKNNLITTFLCLTYQKNNPMTIFLCLNLMFITMLTKTT
ncbi:hypothetical protein [Wolbachia endosymbiont (group A) of Sicus ferrugineus]|uniref:hypothetical protein n=1 Tax=Wolbachia endosymbiont (group A) of Sicus ferrugineus TaxID=2954056 RepID=UPI002230B91E|nr:hypothetical protein [Wolbachia endosymbiont (group A) of Sicus ferrugineus]